MSLPPLILGALFPFVNDSDTAGSFSPGRGGSSFFENSLWCGRFAALFN